jgi:MFS family permease
MSTNPPAESTQAASSKSGSVRALQALNFFCADVQNGMGPYVTLFLGTSAHWNPAQIGTAMAAGNIAQVVAQTPAGVLIDRLRHKRELILGGILTIAVACLLTVKFTTVPVVALAQTLVGIAGAIFPPCLAAIALGLVGRARMDRQMGTNQAFNAAGNMMAALAIGAIGYFFGLGWMFYLVVGLCFVAAFCAMRIRADDIDFNLACGADGEPGAARRKQDNPGSFGSALVGLLQGLGELVREKPVAIFLACAVLFHFANAAMVPLVTEMLGKNQGAKSAVLYTSGYMLASQLVFVVVAASSGRLAGRIGRKPLFLFAFAALTLRGILYTFSNAPGWLIAVQCMDGLGAGIFGVVGVLIIADLTRGTGRFNAAQGAIATAQGMGAFLSNAMAGWLAKHEGTTFTFCVLSAIAAAGLLLFACFMPETRGWKRGERAGG